MPGVAVFIIAIANAGQREAIPVPFEQVIRYSSLAVAQLEIGKRYEA